MYTLDDFMKMDELEQAEQNKILTEIRELTTQVEQLKQKMSEATNAGKIQDYTAADAEYRAINARLRYLREQMAKPALLYTRENVLTAWADYAEEYNDMITGKLADYELARHELAKQFMELVTWQAKALKVRDQLNRLAKKAAGAEAWGSSIDKDLADLELIPAEQKTCVKYDGRSVPVDVAFFCLHSDLARDLYGDLVQIVGLQIPVNLDDSHRNTGAWAGLVRSMLGLNM